MAWNSLHGVRQKFPAFPRNPSTTTRQLPVGKGGKSLACPLRRSSHRSGASGRSTGDSERRFVEKESCQKDAKAAHEHAMGKKDTSMTRAPQGSMGAGQSSTGGYSSGGGQN